MSENSITIMELNIANIHEDASLEYVCEVITQFEAMQQRIREAKKQFEAALTEYIKAHGDVTIGTTRYYLGHPKKTECPSNLETLSTLYETVGPQKTAECLSYNAWKHGAAKSVLEEADAGDQYDRLFVTTYGEKLEAGKPVKQLQKLDTAFVR